MNCIISQPETICAETNSFIAHKANFKWTICDFTAFCATIPTGYDDYATVESSEFSVLNENLFQVSLSLNGTTGEHKGHICTCLVYQGIKPVRIEFSISFLDQEGRKKVTRTALCLFTYFSYSWGWSRFASRKFVSNNENGLLHDGKLSVLCEMTVYLDQPIDHSSAKQSRLCQELASKLHITDLNTLLNDSFLSDVVLVVNEHNFKAHKCLLANRSRYFAEMFIPDDEKNCISERVHISDVGHKVFKELLHFIYTGQVSSMDNVTLDLFTAAHKFQVESLKVLCSQWLGANLLTDSVASVLLIAEEYHDEKLKKQCIEYINAYSSKVFATEAWKVLAKSRPDILVSVLQVSVAISSKRKFVFLYLLVAFVLVLFVILRIV